jgi:hypothetical protein
LIEEIQSQGPNHKRHKTSGAEIYQTRGQIEKKLKVRWCIEGQIAQIKNCNFQKNKSEMKKNS